MPIKFEMKNYKRYKRARFVFLVFLALFESGCQAPRASFTMQQQELAGVPEIDEARAWADDGKALTKLRSFRPALSLGGRMRILALSGGGAEGAFGAGLLVGWSQNGTRPEFNVVTGSSIGGLIAPYAFLGSSYDELLEKAFTSGGLENLLKLDGLNGLFGAGVFKIEPLRELVRQSVDESLLDAIAFEHRRGRRLYIVTSNIDAQRTVIWNMGAIAASKSTGRLELFRTILVATAAVPGMFAPAYIEVQTATHRFQEMHVDGGVTSNILAVPEALLLQSFGSRGGQSELYVIVNGKISPDFSVIDNNTLSIVTRSFFTSVKANTRNTLIATYAFAKRNQWQFHIASIPQAYPIASVSVNFETAYMRNLFALGQKMAQSGKAFHRQLRHSDGHALFDD